MLTGKIGRGGGTRATGLLTALVLAALAGWIAGPGVAFADSRCKDYCSGPHKEFNECMEKCINSQQTYHPRGAERSVEDLCRSRGHDEASCLRDHGFREGPPPGSCYRDQWGRTVCERY